MMVFQSFFYKIIFYNFQQLRKNVQVLTYHAKMADVYPSHGHVMVQTTVEIKATKVPLMGLCAVSNFTCMPVYSLMGPY